MYQSHVRGSRKREGDLYVTLCKREHITPNNLIDIHMSTNIVILLIFCLVEHANFISFVL